MRRRSLLLLLLLLSVRFWGQVNYYEDIEGLTTIELKRALHDLIQPRYVLKYGSGEGHTWQGFWQTDRMADDQVCDRYGDEVRYFNPDDTTASITDIDIEHVWAKSWFGGSLTVSPARDLFNLLPSDFSANRSKSNNPIGVVNTLPGFDNGSVKRGNSTVTYPGETVNVWEPADKWKGDFARIYFYMATCYWDVRDEDGNSLWVKESQRTLDGSEWPTLLPNVYTLMLQWARQDPVDSIEIKRNEAVYKIQGNRNPFVDMPSLSEYIWGTMLDSAFHADAVVIVPVDIDPIGDEENLGDFFEDFEMGTKGGAYADEREVACTAATWKMADALLKMPDSDKHNGEKAVRLRAQGSVEMTTDYKAGCDSLYFYSGMYGSDKGACLSVYYSTDGSSTWLPVIEGLPVTGWEQYSYKLDVRGNVRLRFVCDGANTQRVNVDDVKMTPYILSGDLDGDGQLTADDVDVLVAVVLGERKARLDRVADLDGDGHITLRDVTTLVDKLKRQ